MSRTRHTVKASKAETVRRQPRPQPRRTRTRSQAVAAELRRNR